MDCTNKQDKPHWSRRYSINNHYILFFILFFRLTVKYRQLRARFCRFKTRKYNSLKYDSLLEEKNVRKYECFGFAIVITRRFLSQRLYFSCWHLRRITRQRVDGKSVNLPSSELFGPNRILRYDLPPPKAAPLGTAPTVSPLKQKMCFTISHVDVSKIHRLGACISLLN